MLESYNPSRSYRLYQKYKSKYLGLLGGAEQAAETPDLSKLLKCPQCNELYKSPKLLSCGDSVCRGCLGTMINDPAAANPLTVIQCPQCRQDIDVSGGIDSLPNNQSLLGMTRWFTYNNNSLECAICLGQPYAKSDDGECLGPINATCDNCTHEGTAFHKPCLERAISTNNKCPICRETCRGPSVSQQRAARRAEQEALARDDEWLRAEDRDGLPPQHPRPAPSQDGDGSGAGIDNRRQRSHSQWGLGTPGNPIRDGRPISGSSFFCNIHGYTTCYRGSCMDCTEAATGLRAHEICLGGDGEVKLQDGTSKLVKELLVGDLVESQGGYSKITQVVSSYPSTRPLCQVDGVILTHRHPIYREGVWCHPREVADTYLDNVPVYNFVMDGSPDDQMTHTIIVDGLTCATLGCGPANLAVIKPDTDAKYGRGYWNLN